MQVTIPVPSTVFSSLPASAAKPGLIEFQLIPIFFNVGVNEQALLAERFGDMSAVNATNLQSFERLDNYHRRYQKLMTEFFPGKSKFAPTLSSTLTVPSSFSTQRAWRSASATFRDPHSAAERIGY